VILQGLDREFIKNFLISCGAHLALFLLVFAGGQVISRVFQNSDVEIIRSSVRVDVVGMPKFTIQELKEMQARPVPVKEPDASKGQEKVAAPEREDEVKKDDLVIQEEGKKKQNFLRVLNEYSSRQVEKKELKKGIKSGTGSKNLESLVLEGNRLSKGSALVGDYSDEENSEFSSYVQNLPGIIRPFWKLPSYLMEKNLRCRIKIFLSPDGKLLKLELQESSGVSEFDARAEQAVRSASFPMPSGTVGLRLTRSGIILGFPL
jgi:TonB family protein